MEDVWVPIRDVIAPISAFHYVIAVFSATIVYLWLFRLPTPKDTRPKLTEAEKDEIIANWTPDPLVSHTDHMHPVLNPRFIEGKMGKYVKIGGKEYLNIGTSDFLGFVGDTRIEEVAKKTILKYGVGSCGPRGFYGTADVHLDLEKELAAFLGCEEAVLYSYGFATVASAIPAYAKRSDIIYVDKGVNFAIQKGIQASRSRIEWFEHNDTDDLERLLKIQADADNKNPKKAALTRRFIIVEGLYAKSADLCPLPKLIELKWKYKVRIFVDESYSFGIMGKTGRGVTEHYGVDVIDVDMIMASLENAIASTGGFCAGRSFVVAHQRLSGLGYCFSASLPPLLATAASEALRVMEGEPDKFERLRRNAKAFHDRIRAAVEGTKFRLYGYHLSPMKHLAYESTDADLVERKLTEFVDMMFEKGVVVSRARYLDNEEVYPTTPSVKLMANSELSEDELEHVLSTVAETLQYLSRN